MPKKQIDHQSEAALAESYAAVARDKAREREAEDWCEGLLPDLAAKLDDDC